MPAYQKRVQERAYNIKFAWVNCYLMFSLGMIAIIQVPRRLLAGKPGILTLTRKASLDVFGQVIGILFGHAEFQMHPEFIIAGVLK
jgi:hypothetical protein